MIHKDLGKLIKYIYNNIMESEYDRILSMSFNEQCIYMFVFEQEIPIIIERKKVYVMGETEPRDRICAELCAELLRDNIGVGWLEELDKICQEIEENQEIFKSLLKRKEN